MRKIISTNNSFRDMHVAEIISISSSVFFTSLLVLSAYLMSIQQYHYGFASLVAVSVYFVANNAANLKLVTALAWVGVMIFSLKGFLGI